MTKTYQTGYTNHDIIHLKIAYDQDDSLWRHLVNLFLRTLMRFLRKKQA